MCGIFLFKLSENNRRGKSVYNYVKYAILMTMIWEMMSQSVPNEQKSHIIVNKNCCIKRYASTRSAVLYISMTHHCDIILSVRYSEK